MNTQALTPNPDHLEDLLSTPAPVAIEALGHLQGDMMFLGVNGKMGLSLARMARRASEAAGIQRRIYGASRFSNMDSGTADLWRRYGIEPIVCDLLDEAAVRRLPEAPLVVFMAGMKFGGSSEPARMWAMNTIAPAYVCQRYPASRWIVFSTGNVYPFSPIASGGPDESVPPEPVGEYGMSCLGRERVFEHFSRVQNVPMSILRLNYACDLRYGVLVDLARKVWTGQTIDLAMGYFNTIWQGDANAVALAALTHVSSPPWILNITGTETLSLRSVCTQFGKLMNKPVLFTGHESENALLSNAHRASNLFGTPSVSTSQLIDWVAQWIMREHPTLKKPTGFETRDGRF